MTNVSTTELQTKASERPHNQLHVHNLPSFCPKFEKRKKLFLLGSINPLENPAQGAWKKRQNSQICEEALSAKIPGANRQMVNIARVLKPQLCASGSLRSMCVIIKVVQII